MYLLEWLVVAGAVTWLMEGWNALLFMAKILHLDVQKHLNHGINPLQKGRGFPTKNPGDNLWVNVFVFRNHSNSLHPFLHIPSSAAQARSAFSACEELRCQALRPAPPSQQGVVGNHRWTRKSQIPDPPNLVTAKKQYRWEFKVPRSLVAWTKSQHIYQTMPWL